MSYDLHDRVRITAVFTVAGVEADPTAVTFSYRTPAGVTTVLTYGDGPDIVKVAPGQYRIDLDLDIAGVWYYRWRATGTVVAATPDAHLEVRSSIFD